jgi:hypothetical protein
MQLMKQTLKGCNSIIVSPCTEKPLTIPLQTKRDIIESQGQRETVAKTPDMPGQREWLLMNTVELSPSSLGTETSGSKGLLSLSPSPLHWAQCPYRVPRGTCRSFRPHLQAASSKSPGLHWPTAPVSFAVTTGKVLTEL